MLRRLIVAAYLVPLLLAATARADLPTDRLQRLLDLLTDHDYRVRLQSAIALGQVKDSRAVPALIRRLTDINPLVRGMAAAALGDIGDERAVGPLRERLRDQDELVRRRVRVSLEQIHKPRRSAARQRGNCVDARSAVGRLACKSHHTILLRLGGVGDRTKRGKVLLPELRRLWAERISSTPGIRLVDKSGAVGQKVYEVNAAITELSSQHHGSLVETTCSVSVVVGDYRGSILMMTTGGATVQIHSRRFNKSQEPALQTSALANAVESAHSNVVKFLAARD